jgi:hypothetical protein
MGRSSFDKRRFPRSLQLRRYAVSWERGPAFDFRNRFCPTNYDLRMRVWEIRHNGEG